jgi:hypothetical protein
MAKSKKPEPEPVEAEEDDGSTERNRKRNALLSRKKKMSGYRARAKMAGIGRNISGRLFTNSDLKRMLTFCPQDHVLSYSAEEFQRRRVLAATPVPPSAAQALGPTIDSLARRLVETAAKAAYVAGRPSIQPYDLVVASRQMMSVMDFTILDAVGLARFGQTHDHRGQLVSARKQGEEAREPILNSDERDGDSKKEDKALLKQYAEIAKAVDEFHAARIAKKAAKKAAAGEADPAAEKEVEEEAAPVEKKKKKKSSKAA